VIDPEGNKVELWQPPEGQQGRGGLAYTAALRLNRRRMTDETALQEQIAYYRARAAEYDEWFLRTGRYDRGPAHRAAWEAEVATVERALREALPDGEILELACGTGLWTRHLVGAKRRVMAVDAAPEVLEINRARLPGAGVEYATADLFSWVPPAGRFDALFFGFWLSHVPADRFEPFWAMVRAALKPGGQIFWIDSLLEPASTARDHAPLDQSGVVSRRLNDGREFKIVKIFYEPTELEGHLTRLGWRGWVRSSGQFFHYGCMKMGEI
jgi:demethylmenaquinone methyltransferase/2-methoxy-6-polyprenyl-1,4-benzoquinol methylase